MEIPDTSASAAHGCTVKQALTDIRPGFSGRIGTVERVLPSLLTPSDSFLSVAFSEKVLRKHSFGFEFFSTFAVVGGHLSIVDAEISFLQQAMQLSTFSAVLE